MGRRGNQAPVIGIDLGTTYSCVAVWKNDRIKIIPNDQGNRTTPSAVAFLDAERLVSDGAKNQAAMNPANTIFDAKRLIGRRFSDPNVQADLKLWPFRVTQGPADTPKIVITYKGQDKELLAEEISSMILGKMKETAGAYLGKVVKDAVLTVPAYFNDSQRQATKDAATISGLNVVRMINEPIAAAIAYGMDNRSTILGKINVLIFDLGGGTFDVSLMTIEEGGVFEVKAVTGDTHLGGVDFDNRMVEYCVREFKRKWNKDLTGNQSALERLRFACEKAKRILSSTSQTLIDLDCFHEGTDFSMKFSRAKFEELNLDLFNKCMETMKTCLSDAKMEKSCVDQVILVGGSTRIPKVQGMLEEFFDGKELCKSLNPDEAIAYGAAMLAAKLGGNCNMIVQDEAKVNVNVNKRVKDVLLHDATPLSLGIEVSGDRFHVIIPRNTPIPTRKIQELETKIPIKVYQGERSKSTDNNFLGEFTISGLPRARKRATSIMIYFEIDVKGILTVTAGKTSTGKMGKLTITNENRGLSEVEIKKMINDAKKYKREDREFKKRADAYTALDLYLSRMKWRIKPFKIMRWVDPEMWELTKAATNTTKWLQENQNASVSELEFMKTHLEFVCRRCGLKVN